MSVKVSVKTVILVILFCFSSPVWGKLDSVKWENLSEHLAKKSISLLELNVSDCPDDIADFKPSRVVAQVIENTFYLWEEYDIPTAGGDETLCIVMKKPRSWSLTNSESRVLLTASTLWKQSKPRPEDKIILDASDPNFDIPPIEQRDVYKKELLKLKDVVGSDDRIRITDTSSVPWMYHCYLSFHFSGHGSFRGSGCLVSPYMVLTCGHNVYDRGWVLYIDQVTIAPGQIQDYEDDPVTRPYGTREGLEFVTNTDYITCTNNERHDYDYAAMFFSPPFSGISTYIPVEFSASLPVGEILQTAGYPAEVQGESNSKALWSGSGTVDSYTTAKRLWYTIDSTGGQSGSPVLKDYTGSKRIVAVHAFGTTIANGGPRLRAYNQALIEGWMEWTPPRLCSDCEPEDEYLGAIGTNLWGYSVGGNCGNEGKWVGEFVGQAGAIYHFDLCPDSPGNGTNSGFNPDIKITDSLCTILAGEDGSCSAPSYSPNNFQWICPADGTYYVIIAPFNSYNSHTCNGDVSDTFTLEYYKEEQCYFNVTSPDGGSWKLGDELPITWSSAFTSGNVKIELYKTGSLERVIEQTWPDSGSYDWSIPVDYSLIAGSDYQIKITDVSDSLCYDYSAYFSIRIPPTNDECIDAIAVTEAAPYLGSSAGASGTSTSSCGFGDTNDVWHSFTPTSSSTYSISLCGSAFDTTLAVYDGCGGTELACNDDFCGIQSEVHLYLTGGYTYFIRVAGYYGLIGDYILTVTDMISPANDECIDAIPVTEAAPYYGLSVGATGAAGSCGYDDANDVWHSFTPTSTGAFSISLCGSAFDTTLAVYDGCGGTQLVCNDDFCSSQSQVSVSLTGGHTYFIRIAGYGGGTGSYTLTVSEITPPSNDDCQNSIPVTASGTYYGSTVYATGNFGSLCSLHDSADVWHAFTPSSTGLATMSLRNSTFDTTLAVFDGCDGNEIACNDDISWPGIEQSEMTMAVIEARTYFIRIAGYGAGTGDYTLEVTHTPCVSPNVPNNPFPQNTSTDVSVDTILSWNDAWTLAFEAKSINLWPGKNMMTPKIIYGQDNRREECEVTDPDILSIGDSTAALVGKSNLVDNGDGTFSLLTVTYADWYNIVDPIGTGNPLCLDEPYRDQPKSALCSGFLVAPDIIATAGHCESAYGCGEIAVVFGFVMSGPGCDTPVLTLDESEIYYCTEVIASTIGSDWALLRLDREVVGHSPLNVRLTGAIESNEPLIVVGHPLGLPRKYAEGAEVKESVALSPFFKANLDTYVGNSGSAVFNIDTLMVEGVLVGGGEDWQEGDTCDNSYVCPDSGCPDWPWWEVAVRTTEFTLLFPWAAYDVYFGTTNPPSQLIYTDLYEPTCQAYDPCTSGGALVPGTKYYWQIVAKNACTQIDGPVWNFTTKSESISLNLNLNHQWMYQNLPDNNDSNSTASVSITDDPKGNSSYTYAWEFILPSDVNSPPTIIVGGQAGDAFCSFAALCCQDPNGLSDSGQPLTVKVTVIGNDYGNTGTAEAQFGIALLGDVDNDSYVDVADRSIINVFWRKGSAGSFTFRDCDLDCDGFVDVADRSIANAIWRGNLGQRSVSVKCPFR